MNKFKLFIKQLSQTPKYEKVGHLDLVYQRYDNGAETEKYITLWEDKELQLRTSTPDIFFTPLTMWKQYEITTEQLLRENGQIK